MSRGGRRNGKPGQAYSNRTDLNTHLVNPLARGQLPVQAGPSQQYGQQTAQEQAQRAVPMGSPALPPAAPTTPPAAPPVLPGSLPPLIRPTDRPGEPVTAGLPFGAGPGPEALTPQRTPQPVVQAAALLNALGDTASPQVKALRDALTQTAGQVALP